MKNLIAGLELLERKIAQGQLKLIGFFDLDNLRNAIYVLKNLQRKKNE